MTGNGTEPGIRRLVEWRRLQQRRGVPLGRSTGDSESQRQGGVPPGRRITVFWKWTSTRTCREQPKLSLVAYKAKTE